MIPKFKRLPPPTGIPFSGFEYAPLESRKEVEKKIESFINLCKHSRSVNIALIRGDWGEGKTDIVDRFIQQITKSGDYAYKVSTSTVISQLEKLDKIQSTTAVRFLISLFSALYLELRDQSKGDNPFIDNRKLRFSEPTSYITDVLNFHFSNSQGKMFIFIDEFEEILSYGSEMQRVLISGIKEVINGQYGAIAENGEYAGRLHFVLACTPYAYNKLKEDADLMQILGALLSRLGTNVIDLPQLRKYDALQFLLNLLRYSYDDNNPPIPFASIGVLTTLVTISQRNPRALVQLFCDLMNNAVVKDNNSEYLRAIDYELVIQTLKNKEISIFGGTQKCIDGSLYDEIVNRLDNNSEKIFRLLIGELKPFSIQEISNRLNIDNDIVQRSIYYINNKCKELGIRTVISGFMPLYNKYKIRAVIDKLEPTNETVQLLEKNLQFSELIDSLVQYEISDTNINGRIFMPNDLHELEDLLDINENDAEYLYKRIEEYFDKDNIHYMISQELIAQLFPSPAWQRIEFIKDRNKRLELWRETVKNFSEYNEKLKDEIRYHLRIESINLEKKTDNEYILKYEYKVGNTIEIPTLVEVILTKVTVGDIKNILRKLNNSTIHLILLVHTAEIENNDAQELLNKYYQFLPLYLKPIHAQQLLVAGLAREKNIEINMKVLESKVTEIISDLKIKDKINEWLNKIKREGKVIDDLIKTSSMSDTDIVDAYRTLLLFINKDIGSAWKEYEKLNRFRIYGKKAKLEFNPLDIESEDEFKRLVNSLENNNFVEIKNNKIVFKETDIEKWLLDIIQNNPISLQEIKNRFLIIASSKDILEKVYLSILQHKGLIKLENNRYIYIDEQNITNKLSTIRSKINIIEQTLSQYKSFAHICVSKERKDNVIWGKEFVDILNAYYDECIHAEDPIEKRFKANVLEHMNDYFLNTIVKIVKAAYKETKSKYEEIKADYSNISQEFADKLERYNEYIKDNKKVPEDIYEFSELKKEFEEIEKEFNKNYEKEELQNELSRIRKSEKELPFHYSKYDEKDLFKINYCNMKYYKITGEAQKITASISKIREKVKEINPIDISVLRKEKEKISNIDASGYRIAQKVKEVILNSILNKEELVPEPPARLDLQHIKEFFNHIRGYVDTYCNEVNKYRDQLSTTIKLEREFTMSYRKLESYLTRAKSFLDNTQWYESIGNINKGFEEVTKEYDNLISMIEINGGLSTINNKLHEFNTQTNEYISEIDNIKTKLNQIIERNKNDIMKLLSYVKKKNIMFEEVEKEFIDLINKCKESINTFDGNWNELSNQIKLLKAKIYNKIESSDILTRKEIEVLYKVIDLYNTNRPIILDDISDVDANNDEIINIVLNLAKKGFIKINIILI